MEEAKTMKTPMSSSIKLDKNGKGKSIDSTMYRESHLSAIKKILKYLKGTMDIGLWYPKRQGKDHKMRKCAKLKSQNVDCCVLDRLKPLDWILGRLEARVSDLGHFLFLSRVTISFNFDFSPFLDAHVPLPLGYRASAQLSRLSRRHAERQGLTPSCSVLWRTTSGTNNTLLRDEYFLRKMLIFPNFSISELRVYSLGWIHLGHLMIIHMISCCESTTRVLPYGHFLTRVFKDANVDLSREMDFEAPNTYDTYDD
ncbi:hypothetical protein AAG906_038524 [Vitis piasezkii]